MACSLRPAAWVIACGTRSRRGSEVQTDVTLTGLAQRPSLPRPTLGGGSLGFPPRAAQPPARPHSLMLSSVPYKILP